MEFKGTKTEDILYKAFSGELKVSFRYSCFAEAVRKTGMEQIADIFEATAKNELEHARHVFDFLYRIDNTVKNIEQAIQNEAEESARFYPEAEKIAQGEGFTEIADFFRKMSKVEAKHEMNFRDLLLRIENGIEFEGRTVGHSAVEMAQLMLPDQANPAGHVHGGELMKLMDNAAGVVAARHARTNVVTGSVEDIKFLNPVSVGNLVMVHGKLIFVSHSSMKIKIEVEVEDIISNHAGRKKTALIAYFVMVALDRNGKAMRVPPLILSTEEEEVLFKESEEKYKLAKNKRSVQQ